jgi:hypothetical protein
MNRNTCTAGSCLCYTIYVSAVNGYEVRRVCKIIKAFQDPLQPKVEEALTALCSDPRPIRVILTRETPSSPHFGASSVKEKWEEQSALQAQRLSVCSCHTDGMAVVCRVYWPCDLMRSAYVCRTSRSVLPEVECTFWLVKFLGHLFTNKTAAHDGSLRQQQVPRWALSFWISFLRLSHSSVTLSFFIQFVICFVSSSLAYLLYFVCLNYVTDSPWHRDCLSWQFFRCFPQSHSQIVG